MLEGNYCNMKLKFHGCAGASIHTDVHLSVVSISPPEKGGQGIEQNLYMESELGKQGLITAPLQLAGDST